MKNLCRPKMIIFDFGNTLLHEPDFNPLRGDSALSGYITKNPNCYSPAYISAYTNQIFLSAKSARDAGFEMHEHALLRLVNDSLGLEYSLTVEEQETIFWENASTAEPMPYVEMLLEQLFQMNIRSAVISNISFSGKALRRKIDRALPDNHVEFVIASSEYGIRKPNPLLFQTALRMAGVSAEETWYCGDNFQADVIGASAAGIFPVWYRGACESEEITEQTYEWINMLSIHSWSEMIDLFKQMQ